jgi:hypothetical protein
MHDDDYDVDLPSYHYLLDWEVNAHHGLYWKQDRVLEAPANEMPVIHGHIKTEKVTVLWVYWKITSSF